MGEQARRFATERQGLERELKAARAEAALGTSLRDAAESDAVAAAEARARKAATEAAGLRDEVAVATQARRQALSDLALVSATRGGARWSKSQAGWPLLQATEASERRLRDEVARVRRDADEKLRTAASTESDLKVGHWGENECAPVRLTPWCGAPAGSARCCHGCGASLEQSQCGGRTCSRGSRLRRAP